MFVADPWNAATGYRAMIPGAKAHYLSAVKNGNVFEFRYRLTNYCRAIIQLTSAYGDVIETINPGNPQEGGDYVEYRWYNNLPMGQSGIMLKVSVLPYCNDNIPSYARRPWYIYNSNVVYNLLPLTAELYGPGWLPIGEPGTFAAVNVSGGLAPYTFWWYKKIQCCYSAQQSPNGTRTSEQPDAPPACGTYEYVSTGSASTTMAGLYNFTAMVRIIDARGSFIERTLFTDVGRCYPNDGGGGGCPFVFTWNGKGFVEDNNILPQSESVSGGEDVIDRYKLMQTPVPRGNQYVLQIREEEREQTRLDQVKLIAVDHPQSRDVMMKSSGEIVPYAKLFTLKRAKLHSRDVLQEVKRFDGATVAAGTGDILDLSFSSGSGGIQDGAASAADESVIKSAGRRQRFA